MPRAPELYGSQWPSYIGRVRQLSVIALAALLLSVACDRDKRYPLTGQVIAVHIDRQELTVAHEDIRGFMPGMTMPFRVRDAGELRSVKPGDLITATLVVEETTGYLDRVRKTGEKPLPEGVAHEPASPILQAGEELPDAAFLDQDGRARRFADWRGHVVAVTFVYTRCPLPDFCPLMDRHFRTVQTAILAEPALRERVRLVSISFDPEFDTPDVLKRHAARVGADPAVWSYLTGTREAVERFGVRLGVTIMRNDGTPGEILHNLRTAVIDGHGRLVKVVTGNDWQPAQLLEELRAADAGR